MINKLKLSGGCLFVSFIILCVIFVLTRLTTFSTVSVSFCRDSITYVKGSCIFQVIDDRYIVLRKRYRGNSDFLPIIGTSSTPVFLYDKVEKKIIKKGKILFGVSPSDLEVNKAEGYTEFYYKSNYENRIFWFENTPSIIKPWRIKKE